MLDNDYICGMEKFKNIQGYEGIYQISNFGNIKTVKTQKISNGWEHNQLGYRKARLYRDNKAKDIYIHRLVAIHFVPNKSNKPSVNHIDHNPRNNHYKNLEWCTHKENMEHASKAGRIDKNGQRIMNLETNEVFASIKAAAESVGINENTLVYRLRRRSKLALNFIKL